jgi:hypothetical protein
MTKETVIACAPMEFRKDGKDSNTASLEIKQRFGRPG